MCDHTHVESPCYGCILYRLEPQLNLPRLPADANDVVALQAGLNWDASVSRLGFCGANAEHLWLTSNTEGLCLWEWQAACDEEGTGQRLFCTRPSHADMCFSVFILGSIR